MLPPRWDVPGSLVCARHFLFEGANGDTTRTFAPGLLTPDAIAGAPRQQTVCGPLQEDGSERSSQSEHRESSEDLGGKAPALNIWCLTARNQEKTGNVCKAKHLLRTKLADSESPGDYGGSGKLLIVVFCGAMGRAKTSIGLGAVIHVLQHRSGFIDDVR